jgi:hypothetical protein
MRNILLIGISFVLLTAGTALATKGYNSGGGKFDAEAAIQAEKNARIAADADLQNQITAEESPRIDGDADLQNQIDNNQIGASGGLKLYDANNQFLGFLMSYDGGNGLKEFDAKVYNPTFGGIIEWNQRYSEQDGIKFRLRNDGQQLFSNADCTGLTYADVGCCGMGTIKTLREFYGSKEFFIVTDGPFWVSSDDIKSRTSHDVNDQVYCEPIHYNDTQIELYEYKIVEAPFSFPVTNPVRIGL